MTRINVIPVELLLNEHTLAEFREITRVPNAILSGKAKVDLSKIPAVYTLGKGHVTFFYNKLNYIIKRYNHLYKELCKRGYKVTYHKIDLSQLPPVLVNALCKDYQPTKEALVVNVERICERFDLRKKSYNFHNVKINDEYSFNRYLKIVEKGLAL